MDNDKHDDQLLTRGSRRAKGSSARQEKGENKDRWRELGGGEDGPIELGEKGINCNIHPSN